MSCSFADDFEVAKGVLYSAFKPSFDQALVCAETYLRPDPGGSLIPWLYATFLLLFHLPACIIRAVRWESAQYLALTLAVLGIALTVQAYQSTELKAEEVLVWMPLTLVLDTGAMMQMVVLIIEKHEGGVGDLWWAVSDALVSVKKAIIEGLMSRNSEKQASRQSSVELQRRESHGSLRDRPNQVVAADVEAQVDMPAQVQEQAPARAKYTPDALRHAAVAFFAFSFLLILIALQLYGLYAAIEGRKKKDLYVKWCSPTFRDFAIAVTTGDCKKYDVLESSSNGIGCIQIPANQQADWLLGTIIALVAAIACQCVDMVLLKCTNRKRKCRGGVRVQRPWMTMFGGVIILILLIAFGVFNANRLPTGVTNTVWIYRKEPTSSLGRVCRGRLRSPGLRGVIIGYTDGLFESWGSVYQGSVMQRLVRRFEPR